METKRKNGILILVAIMFAVVAAATLFACNPQGGGNENVLVVGTTLEIDSLNRLDVSGVHRVIISTKSRRRYLKFRR